MLKNYFCASLTSLLFISSIAFAGSTQSIAERCNGCTALAAKQAATNIAYLYKTDLAATAAGYLGYVYTYDFNAATITQYGVMESAKRGQLVAIPTGAATPSDVTKNFLIQRSAVLANAASYTFVFNDASSAHPDMPYADRSAFEIVQTSAEQFAIGNWMMTNKESNEGALSAAIESVFLHTDPITIDVTMKMAVDNSFITLEYVAGTGKKFVLVKAMDANFNTIPLVATDAPGRYNFGDKGGPAFTGYLHERFGYSTSDNTCVNGQLACIDYTGGRTCEWLRCD